MTEAEMVQEYVAKGGAVTVCATQAAYGVVAPPKPAPALTKKGKPAVAKAKAKAVATKGKASAGAAICKAYLAGKTVEECVAAAHAAVATSRADRTHVYWYFRKMEKAGTPGLPPWPALPPKVKAAAAKAKPAKK